MHVFDVFGVPLHDMSEDELRARLFDVSGLVITPNPEILLTARQNEAYRSLLASTSLSLPDGVATEFAVTALHNHLQLRRHPGIDVIPLVCAIAMEKRETLLIIGGFAEDHRAMIDRLCIDYPGLVVRCFDPGVVDDAASNIDQYIVDEIKACSPAVALVALGQGRGSAQGKQERIAKFILGQCSNVRCAIGVGGSIDVLSGRVERGPSVLRRWGFEWLWRLMRDPWRAPRIFRAVIIFPLFVAWDTLRNKRFWRACCSVLHNLKAHFTRPLV